MGSEQVKPVGVSDFMLLHLNAVCCKQKKTNKQKNKNKTNKNKQIPSKIIVEIHAFAEFSKSRKCCDSLA